MGVTPQNDARGPSGLTPSEVMLADAGRAAPRANNRLEWGSELQRLGELAHQAGAADVAADARLLAERLVEGRFYVACVGQFKRGKSTLLNGLVGEPILPAGVLPVTSMLTILRHGSERRARIRFDAERWQWIPLSELIDYVSEERNPENSKGVRAVEVFVPNRLLASGMCLVDTPGLGSIFAGNTEITRRFVPHVDVALVVLGADPPLSGEESELVGQLAARIDHLIFVLNKSDRLSDAERTQAKQFAEQVLSRRLGRSIGPIYEVSSLERLASGQLTRDWEQLEGRLESLAHEAGADLIQSAKQRGTDRLADRLQRRLEEQRLALIRPLEQSQQRVEELRRCAAQAERAMKELGPLFALEEQELARVFSGWRDQFLERSAPLARRQLRPALESKEHELGRRLRRWAVREAREQSDRMTHDWLREQQPHAEELYRRTTERFIELANEFLERLAASGEPVLAGMAALGFEVGFRVPPRYYHLEMFHVEPSSALRWLLDLFRPRTRRVKAVVADTGAYLDRLLRTNSARVMNDFIDRVVESRRRLEFELRSRLHDLYSVAESALERARILRTSGSGAVEAELQRLQGVLTRVEGLRSGLHDRS